MLRRLNAHALFALVLVVMNTVYASQILQMNPPFSNGEPGPAFLPMVLSGVLYVAAIRVFFQDLRASQGEADTAGASETVPRIALVGPVLVVALTAAFVAAFTYVGYAVAALGYTFLIALFFNYEESGRWGRALLYSAATSAAITLFGWLFFVKLFDLYLPVWEL